MHRLPTRRTCLAAVTLGLTCGLLALAPLSAAIVPPTDCGSIRVSGKRYTIKADQLRCRTAKP
ncbi:MAG: hypothetical protein QOE31_1322, partial [Solirubrobacteraceae bacterium]|nr:hypothetical protein [Solirubrobacteraceae bacterium]